MIFMVIIAIIIFILVMKIEINFILQNKTIKINLIILKVIKFRLKVKANKSKVKKLNKTLLDEKKINVKKIFEILFESLYKIKYLLSKTIYKIEINYNFYFLSIDKTALLYGILNTFIYSIEMILINTFKEYRGDYNLIPDFKNEYNTIDIKASISIRNIYIIIFVFKMLPILLKNKNLIKKKGGEWNGSSNTRINENNNG